MKRTLYLVLGLVLCLGSNDAFSQKKKKDKASESKAVVATTTKPITKEEKKGPKTFKDILDSTTVSQKGLMSVHKVGTKWYFEIPDSLFNRDIMAVTRFSKTAAGAGKYGGEEVNRQMVRWEKGLDNTILLRSVTIVASSPDSLKPIYKAVKNSNADPIIGVFEVKASQKGASSNSTSSLIDITEFFNSDNQTFSLSPRDKQMFKLSMFKKDASFIESIRSYPINVEIKTTKTFTVVPPAVTLVPMPTVGTYFPAGRDAGVVTLEMNTSFILLPKIPMRKRYFDYRVGYFANQYAVFGEESHKSDKEVFAVRWRLEPKNTADAEKQKLGQLIEPAKPIVFYIDPATPEKWRKYLKAGVDDWNTAFEKAGWKNAIRGEYWPEGDSTMSLEDARFSVIRYFAADIQNAYGPNVHDPRSGEILESHIGWYHNVMSLLRNWYLIQTAAVDPKARNKKFDDHLMGELVRFVAAHEVGHTLGLRHNMGASSATPVEKLRDNEWLKVNGHTSSIMDYARFNYVAQPEDGVTEMFPSIGDYDKWAIQWGYSYFADAKSADEEKAILKKTTQEAYKNSRLHFGTEISPSDPRYQTEDLGDNNMKASEYGIKNLKRILPNLIEWSREEGETYQELDELYSNVVGQYRRYLGHVIKNVGGIYDSPVTYEMEKDAFEVVPAARQKEAVTFLNNQLFTTPTWLMNADILAKIKPETGIEAVKSLQDFTLTSLLANDRAVRLIETATTPEHYSYDRLLTDLESNIWSEVKAGKAVDVYRRNLQKLYTDKLIASLKGGKATVNSIPVGVTYGFNTKTVEMAQTDVPSISRGHLEGLKITIQAAIPRTSDKLTKYHLQDVLGRIKAALDPK